MRLMDGESSATWDSNFSISSPFCFSQGKSYKIRFVKNQEFEQQKRARGAAQAAQGRPKADRRPPCGRNESARRWELARTAPKGGQRPTEGPKAPCRRHEAALGKAARRPQRGRRGPGASGRAKGAIAKGFGRVGGAPPPGGKKHGNEPQRREGNQRPKAAGRPTGTKACSR